MSRALVYINIFAVHFIVLFPPILVTVLRNENSQLVV